MDSNEIKNFLEDYAAGKYGNEQHDKFIEWLKNAPIAEVEAVANQYIDVSKKGTELPKQTNTELLLQIEKALDQYELGKNENQKATKKFIYRRIAFRSVAAILILAVIGYSIFKLQSSNKNAAIAKTPSLQAPAPQILPGTNKAVLTLGDGTVINLDDTRNGKVASQGATQISKLENGQVLYNASSKPDEIFFNTVSTPKGGQFKITLPDGSNVWLNSLSSIRFPTAFTGNERSVKITGEAYFEIAHDASKPFFVNVDEIAIKVLGTEFNVNAYTDEKEIKTTLLQGSVSFSSAGISKTIKPGQQIQKDHSGEIKVLDEVDVDEVVAWKNGYFSFAKADLQMVMRQIARWYDVDIVYEGAIPDRQFGGKISRDSNVSDVLKILKESNVHFKIEGKKIIVIT